MEKATEKATLNRGKHDQVWSIILVEEMVSDLGL